MINITSWTKEFTEKLHHAFKGRVQFIGLQGSYARGEATETSDIDVVVVLDEMNINDLIIYREMLDTLPCRDLICGFISGKPELLHWEASDLFQFYYDTVPLYGTLDFLFEKIDMQSVKRSIRTGACNIYHACVHNFVHERSDDILRSLFKSAVFVLQAICFYEIGKYFMTKSELRNAINPPSSVLETALKLKAGGLMKFEEMSTLLLTWAKTVILGYPESEAQ